MRITLFRSIGWIKKPGARSSLLSGELLPYLVIFSVCFFILAGALILRPANPGSSHIQLGGISLPDVCVMRGTTGLPCPGCGLTRSIVAAVHGDIRKSLVYHRLGLLTLVYVLLQFLFCLGFLLIPIWRTRLERYGKFLNQGIIILGVLFFLNWIITLTLVLT